LTKNNFNETFTRIDKNTVLLAINKEYFSQKYEKILFLTKYRISAQNRMSPCALSLSRGALDNDVTVNTKVLKTFGTKGRINGGHSR